MNERGSNFIMDKKYLERMRRCGTEFQALLMQYITKITEDKKKLTGAIVVIVAVLFIDFSFILGAQMRLLATLSPKITKLRQDLKNLNSDLIKMQRKDSGLATSGGKRIIQADEISWVIEEISRLADQNEVKISQIKPGRETLKKETSPSPSRREEYSSTLVDLDVSAGYHQLARFLADLENHPVCLEVEELNIEHNEKNPFEHNVDLSLKIYVSK